MSARFRNGGGPIPMDLSFEGLEYARRHWPFRQRGSIRQLVVNEKDRGLALRLLHVLELDGTRSRRGIEVVVDPELADNEWELR